MESGWPNRFHRAKKRVTRDSERLALAPPRFRPFVPDSVHLSHCSGSEESPAKSAHQSSAGRCALGRLRFGGPTLPPILHSLRDVGQMDGIRAKRSESGLRSAKRSESLYVRVVCLSVLCARLLAHLEKYWVIGGCSCIQDTFGWVQKGGV